MSESWDLYSKAVSAQPYQKKSNKEMRHLRNQATFELDHEAWQEMWVHTLRLVIHVVRKLQASKIITFEEYQEAVAVGNAVAGEALLNWDPRRSPYQSWLWRNITWGVRQWVSQERSCGLTGGHNEVPVLHTTPDEETTDADVVEQAAQYQLLLDRIRELPEGQSAVLQAVFLHGKTISAVADEQGVTYSAVHKTLNQGLEVLRKEFSELG